MLKLKTPANLLEIPFLMHFLSKTYLPILTNLHFSDIIATNTLVESYCLKFFDFQAKNDFETALHTFWTHLCVFSKLAFMSGNNGIVFARPFSAKY